jgi:hypothetical protein
MEQLHPPPLLLLVLPTAVDLREARSCSILCSCCHHVVSENGPPTLEGRLGRLHPDRPLNLNIKVYNAGAFEIIPSFFERVYKVS